MIATLTNLAYLLPAYFLFKKNKPISASSFLLLAFTSGMYHYFYSQGIEYSFWQYADVSSIYLALALLPQAITGNKRWYGLLLVVIPVILNKFNVLAGDFNPDSTILIGLFALPTLFVSFSRLKSEYFFNAIVFLVFAGIFQYIGGNFVMESLGYDAPHGVWHLLSAIMFTFITQFNNEGQ